MKTTRMKKNETIIGNRYGKLTVVAESPRKTKNGKRLWMCLCDCQTGLPEEERKYVIATKSDLERDKKGIKSCGCLKKEMAIINGIKKRKQNTFDLESEEYAIGYTTKGERFIFDKEDYDLVKTHYWAYSSDGFNKYVKADRSRIDKYTSKFMHVAIMDYHYHNGFKRGTHVDHINGDTTDNRKINLRYVNDVQSAYNRKRRKDNSSGFKGVHFHKSTKKWQAAINANKKRIYLGLFENKEDAIIARMEAEKKYFGEYSRAIWDI